MHAYNQVKMIGHDTKTQHIHKIEAAEPAYQIQQIVLFRVFKRKPGQGCTGDYVIHRRDIGPDESGYTGHGSNLQLNGNNHKKPGIMAMAKLKQGEPQNKNLTKMSSHI
jgi:hypothetical protein